MSMTTSAPKAATGYYVALVEDGIPRFSAEPARHDNADVAITEAGRLAASHPGKLFQVFGPRYKVLENAHGRPARFPPMVAYVEPRKTTFTGREVRLSAPVGDYRCTSTRFCFARVLVNGSLRAALFDITGGAFNALLSSNWDMDTFEAIE